MPVPPAAPDVAALVILIRSTILALDQANATGDYSVLRGIGAPGFQANSAETIAAAFTDLRERSLDLSSIAVVNPRLDQEPIIGDVDGRRMMRLTGFFPGPTENIGFDTVFQEHDGNWRLFGIAVNPTGKPSGLPPPAPLVTDGKPVIPEPQVMLAMVRSAVIALNQANLTGNYTVLNKMSAPGFKEANSPSKLEEIFAALRGRDLDLGPVTVIEPGLYRPPAILNNGMLRLTGFFPSQPERVNFDLAYQLIDGEWKLFGIGVNTSREVVEQGTGGGPTTGETPAPGEVPQGARQEPVSGEFPPSPVEEEQGDGELPADSAVVTPEVSTPPLPPSPRLRPLPSAVSAPPSAE